MKFDELFRWLLDFLNSDPFLDWLFTSIFGVFLWWIGSRRRRRGFSLSTAGNTQERLQCIRSLVIEVTGLLLMVWSLLLAFIITNHKQRLNLFWGGMLALMTLGALFCVGMELRYRS